MTKNTIPTDDTILCGRLLVGSKTKVPSAENNSPTGILFSLVRFGLDQREKCSPL